MSMAATVPRGEYRFTVGAGVMLSQTLRGKAWVPNCENNHLKLFLSAGASSPGTSRERGAGAMVPVLPGSRWKGSQQLGFCLLSFPPAIRLLEDPVSPVDNGDQPPGSCSAGV